MEYSFYYGPDKTPFLLNVKGMVESGSAIPFHGIVSRGLLSKLSEYEFGYELWNKYAHLIDKVEDTQDPELKRLQQYVRECGFLLYGQSAFFAKEYLKQYYIKDLKENRFFCELWNIKEGHTSSVWKIDISDEINSFKDVFVLNVARDNDAGIELKTTSEKMQLIGKECSDINMAKVFDIKQLQFVFDDKLHEVVVTRNEWIADSYEIHVVSNKVNSERQYLLVERFLTRDKNPSKITSVYGRKFTEEECSKINEDIDFFLKKTSHYIDSSLNINDGDVVWDGEKAIVIAIS